MRAGGHKKGGHRPPPVVVSLAGLEIHLDSELKPPSEVSGFERLQGGGTIVDCKHPEIIGVQEVEDLEKRARARVAHVQLGEADLIHRAQLGLARPQPRKTRAGQVGGV